MLQGTQKRSNESLVVCLPEQKLEAEVVQQQHKQKMEQLLQRHKTPLVSEEFIASRIKGGTEIRRAEVLKTILQARKSQPYIAKYIDLAFRHLPDFQIYIYSKEQFQKLALPEAGYNSAGQIILLSEVASNLLDKFELIRLIRHEFRHAAMNAIQRTLWNPDPLSPKNYFPVSDKDEVEKMIQKGDNKVKAFQEGKLGSEEIAKLHKLLDEIRVEYSEGYQVPMSIKLPQETVKTIKRELGMALKPGLVINMDKYIPYPLGDVRIDLINPPKDGNQIINFTILEPLEALLFKLLEFPGHVEKHYLKETHLEERDAYLFGCVPVKIIEFFYPELYFYTQNLIDRAVEVPVLASPPPPFLSLKELKLKIIIQELRWAHVKLNAENAKRYLKYSRILNENGYPELAKEGLQELINRGFEQNEARLELARIHQAHLPTIPKKAGDIQSSFNYRKFAKIILSSLKLKIKPDLENYFESLLADKLKIFFNSNKLDPTDFPNSITQGFFNKIQKQLIDNKAALLEKPIFVINQILESCRPRRAGEPLNLLSGNEFYFDNLQISEAHRLQPYGFVGSVLNVGSWTSAGLGILRKWWHRSNGEQPSPKMPSHATTPEHQLSGIICEVKEARSTIKHPPISKTASQLSDPMMKLGSSAKFFTTTASGEFFSPPVKTVNYQQNSVRLETCKTFLYQGDTDKFDKEVLICNTPESVISVYPVNKVPSTNCLPTAHTPQDNLQQAKLIGDTYRMSSCRALGDNAVVCDGDNTTMVYRPKIPSQSLGNSSHVGNTICLVTVAGKMVVNIGSWIRNRETDQQTTENSEQITQSKQFKTLIKRFQKQYPKYRRHLYLQAFRSLRKFNLKDNGDPFDQLHNHLKGIANGEFSNRQRQDKREKEGKGIIRWLSRLYVQPEGTEVFKLLPVEIQEYLHDFAFDAYQLYQQETANDSSKQTNPSMKAEIKASNATVQHKSKIQDTQLRKSPPKTTEQLRAFGLLKMQNRTAPNLLSPEIHTNASKIFPIKSLTN